MEHMAGVEDIGWDSLPIDPDGLGAIGDWHDKSVLHCTYTYTLNPNLGVYPYLKF